MPPQTPLEALQSLLQQFQCFSEDTVVITPNGKKLIKELDVGDYVLTANRIEVGP